MQSPDYQREEALKAKRRDAKEGPRADQQGTLGWASALGNATVQRLLRSLGVQSSGAGSDAVDDSVAKAIQDKRGTGQSLDSAARRDIEPAFGQDFSDVRLHTDADADALNRAVQAEAFTTGRDIFFRSGKYDPGSSEGRKLLTHELTHVVQQRAAPPAQELTVSSPEDASERRASAVAEHIGSSSASAGTAIGRQKAGEEPRNEEEQAAPQLARQEEPLEEEPEEEEMAPSLSRAVAPAAVEEEEEPSAVAPSLARAEVDEEEPAAEVG